MLKISFAKRALLLSSVAGALAFAATAHAQLDRALNIAKGSTAQSAASQARVAAADDQAGSMIRQYRAIQQQIDNIQLFVDQQEIYKSSQVSEISSLNNQLGSVEAIKLEMVPMMLRMTIALEDFIKSDIPFLLDERMARIDRLKQALGNPAIDPAEQYRQVLNAFKIEVAYGQGLESYEGTHPSDPGQIVNFLKYGRTSFIYMSKDESDIARYDVANNEWTSVEGDAALGIRAAIRIAKGEAAPEMVTAPVIVGQNAN